MNTSDRLSPEEHELARLLGRPASAAAPDARIDVAIAELARQSAATPATLPLASPAIVTPPSMQRRRRRGVVPALAVAASLILVVGLAWQLRPIPPSLELPVVAETLPPPDAPQIAAAEMPAAEAIIEPAPPAPRMVAPAQAPVPRANAASTAGSAHAERARKEMSPAVEATSERLAPPSPPAPPAPPAPSLASSAHADIVLPASADTAPARLAAAPSQGVAKPATIALSPELDAEAALPPRQWLQRIRQRHKDGDDDGARASLRRFVEAHPKTRIPRDLRPLLEDS
ncbi:MAG: hypothetical protein WA956_04075 [Stenotrophomonas sp.]